MRDAGRTGICVQRIPADWINFMSPSDLRGFRSVDETSEDIHVYHSRSMDTFQRYFDMKSKVLTRFGDVKEPSGCEPVQFCVV